MNINFLSKTTGAVGSLEFQMHTGVKFHGELFPVNREPSWVENKLRPTENFQDYEVYLRTSDGNRYGSTIVHKETIRGFRPTSVLVSVDGQKYFSYQGFEVYKYEKSAITNSIDHVYMTVAGAQKVYVAYLQSQLSL